MAGSTGFEPAISSVTGRRVRPLHYEPRVFIILSTDIINDKNRGHDSSLHPKKQTVIFFRLVNLRIYLGFFFSLQGGQENIHALVI